MSCVRRHQRHETKKIKELQVSFRCASASDHLPRRTYTDTHIAKGIRQMKNIGKRSRVSTLLLVSLLVVLSGCGDKENSSSSTSSSDQAVLDFAKCMRDNGVDFPDPKTGADGRLQIDMQQGQSQLQSPQEQEAFSACRSKLGNFANIGSGQQQQLQDAALDYAKCMREHGYNMADPDFSQAMGSGGGPGAGGGPFGNVDQSDPTYVSANDACKDKLSAITSAIPGGQ